MLNKQRSTQTAMMKYGLIAPLFIIMIVVSSATLASKELAKIEAKVEEISDKDLAKVIKKPSETVTETLLKDNIDLSKAFIISPDLVDEVKVITKNTRDTNEVFDAVEENPEFIGGMEALGKFLQENLKYPEAAKKAFQWGTVYTEFIVNTDGTTSNFHVLRSVGFGCDEEAVRVLKLVPKWIPGKQNGKVVSSRFIVPIKFILAEEGEVKPKSTLFVMSELKGDVIPNSGAYYETAREYKNPAFSAKPIIEKPKKNFDIMNPPLYIVDGMEVFNVNGIDPKTIEKMEIFQGEKAYVRYGSKAKNGAVVIALKKK